MEISESAFQKQVVELARATGWLSYHTYDSRRSDAGFPDLVLVRPPRIIFAELKSRRGRIKPAQRHWGEQLSSCAAASPSTLMYALWRPADWDSIVEALR